ncbi:glucose dehydrogenase [FAD, quinone]-like [Adelges cooleyi]|uniref:glucose dehydrogenase [FAD, quinone]-like n=1 Tax=Adelges cooleyi TaxID=133065 RepID=UPI00217FE533|nr:glucose dehydrogenase [FAD, quinone]-like [Adelges cooleyi]
MFRIPAVTLALVFGFYLGEPLLRKYLPWPMSRAIAYPSDYAAELEYGESNVQFDFIVVGAGSAGATLAARLSEVAEWNVLLLEAGGDPPETEEVPNLWETILRSDVDWNYSTEPDETMFKGLQDGRVYVPKARMLGGSSSMNVMIYMRGTRRDFEGWVQAGCDGWDYDTAMKYFKKSEDFVDEKRFNGTVHSRGGPLTVSPFVSRDPAVGVFSAGAEELGMNYVADLNRIEPVLGYGMADSTTRDGLRCSTLKAFLLPASERPNLYVAKHTRATRILFDENRKATGVEVLTPGGTKMAISCKLEVIVSAGAIASPQLLMLSGVGPAEHLREMGIGLVADLQVGANFHDHVVFLGLVFTDRKNRSVEEIQAESTKLSAEQVALTAQGKSTLGLSGLITFINTKMEQTYPDVEIMKMRLMYNMLDKSWNGKNMLTNIFGLTDEVAALYNDLNKQSDLLMMLPLCTNIISTGYVQLKSADPLEHPKIVANFLKHQEELETVLGAIDFIVQLSKTEAVMNAGLVLEHLKFPNCDGYEWATRDYWLCSIEQVATSLYHVAGTNKMGAVGDPKTVVDPQMRVKNVTSLRVIDGSAIPHLVAYNPNAVTIMMAEKGADLIKSSYGKNV